jgi:hypothetical protein
VIKGISEGGSVKTRIDTDGGFNGPEEEEEREREREREREKRSMVLRIQCA